MSPNFGFHTVLNYSNGQVNAQRNDTIHTSAATSVGDNLDDSTCLGDGERCHILPVYSSYPKFRGYGFEIESCNGFPVRDQPNAAYWSKPQERMMLPMNQEKDEPPIYVNAKQYHGIIRRRKSRAKALVLQKCDNKRRPYMHYSRHLHAMRRPRGSGGRFLNTKNSGGSEGACDSFQTMTESIMEPQSSVCVSASEDMNSFFQHEVELQSFSFRQLKSLSSVVVDGCYKNGMFTEPS